MREIKFRAWKHNNNNEDNGMHYGVYIANGICFKKNGEELYLRQADYKIMQYTGLKDKNGKEIYEGDIVYLERSGKDHDWKKDGWQNTIVWGGDVACFIEKETGNYIDQEDMSRVEIIGNIYSDPHLLKGDK